MNVVTWNLVLANMASSPSLSVYQCLWAFCRLNGCHQQFEQQFSMDEIEQKVHKDFIASFWNFTNFVNREVELSLIGPQVLFGLLHTFLNGYEDYILHGWFSDECIFYAYVSDTTYVETLYVSPMNTRRPSWNSEE